MSNVRDAGAASLFFALGDATRLGVLRRLQGGRLSASTLAEGAAVTRQAIVKHLQVLSHAGLVHHERCGREVLYALESQRLEEARVLLAGIAAGWDRAIGRLRVLVERPPAPPPRRARCPRT